VSEISLGQLWKHGYKGFGLKDGALWSAYYGGNNYAGKNVSAGSALRLSTVWACVRLLSETIATLPIGFYERQADGSRTSANAHPLYRLLHSQPNADMTAVQFWEVVVASMLLWGNAYVRKVTSSRRIVALDFLLPDRMSVRRLPTGAREYRYRELDGTVSLIPEDELMHIPAFSLDGVNGLSPVQFGANVMGAAMAADETSAGLFKNAMKSPGLVMMDAVLKEGQREQIRDHVKTVADSGGYMVLEKGSSFQQLNMNPEDAELLASRGFNVEELCRWFRVPPFMVGHSEKSTSWGTGIEQQMIGFLTFSLRPWLTRIEQSIRKNLLTPAEQSRYFAEFAIEGLLRADSAARAAFYASAGQNGWMNRNEMRALENLPPVEGGDVLTVQSNLVPIDQLGQQPAATGVQDALKSWLGLAGKESE
jgi:HK97 family phage portal protein